jgi:hypothetical protein
MAAHERAHSLFAAARLSTDPLRYGFRTIRQILGSTPTKEIDPYLAGLYEKWLEIEGRVAFERSWRALSLRPEYIHTLVEIGDPAVFAIHVLERIRAEDYPALYRETRLITPIHFSYELVLNGIHGSTRQHQDSALPKAS